MSCWTKLYRRFNSPIFTGVIGLWPFLEYLVNSITVDSLIFMGTNFRGFMCFNYEIVSGVCCNSPNKVVLRLATLFSSSNFRIFMFKRIKIPIHKMGLKHYRWNKWKKLDIHDEWIDIKEQNTFKTWNRLYCKETTYVIQSIFNTGEQYPS